MVRPKAKVGKKFAQRAAERGPRSIEFGETAESFTGASNTSNTAEASGSADNDDDDMPTDARVPSLYNTSVPAEDIFGDLIATTDAERVVEISNRMKEMEAIYRIEHEVMTQGLEEKIAEQEILLDETRAALYKERTFFKQPEGAFKQLQAELAEKNDLVRRQEAHLEDSQLQLTRFAEKLELMGKDLERVKEESKAKLTNKKAAAQINALKTSNEELEKQVQKATTALDEATASLKHTEALVAEQTQNAKKWEASANKQVQAAVEWHKRHDKIKADLSRARQEKDLEHVECQRLVAELSRVSLERHQIHRLHEQFIAERPEEQQRLSNALQQSLEVTTRLTNERTGIIGQYNQMKDEKTRLAAINAELVEEKKRAMVDHPAENRRMLAEIERLSAERQQLAGDQQNAINTVARLQKEIADQKAVADGYQQKFQEALDTTTSGLRTSFRHEQELWRNEEARLTTSLATAEAEVRRLQDAPVLSTGPSEEAAQLASAKLELRAVQEAAASAQEAAASTAMERDAAASRLLAVQEAAGARIACLEQEIRAMKEAHQGRGEEWEADVARATSEKEALSASFRDLQASNRTLQEEVERERAAAALEGARLAAVEEGAASSALRLKEALQHAESLQSRVEAAERAARAAREGADGRETGRRNLEAKASSLEVRLRETEDRVRSVRADNVRLSEELASVSTESDRVAALCEQIGELEAELASKDRSFDSAVRAAERDGAERALNRLHAEWAMSSAPFGEPASGTKGEGYESRDVAVQAGHSHVYAEAATQADLGPESAAPVAALEPEVARVASLGYVEAATQADGGSEPARADWWLLALAMMILALLVLVGFAWVDGLPDRPPVWVAQTAWVVERWAGIERRMLG
ncbi:MAG: hypothetical protein M1838_000788 [Thelocarpon superellum]|nr:MAG: hypothetical protein M1838_000788 [Thelocarpon superellum]